MKKKRKLKKGVKKTLLLFIILCVGLIISYKIYKKIEYKKTYEYQLLEKGYTLEDTTYFINHWNNEELNTLLSKEYNVDIVSLSKEKYFLYKNLDKYLTYLKQNGSKSYEEVVKIVNVHRDTEFYTNTQPADTSLGNLMLVNKYYYLDQSYIDSSLVNVSTTYSFSGNSCSEETLDAFISMYQEALKSDIELIINSSYRSYEEQEVTWTTRKNTKGTESADSYAARAGYSEHQTGLALDIYQYNYTAKEGETLPAYTWLSNNAYKYGFILRYPEGLDEITGYSYEPWHYRYVGKEVAKKIHDENITFEEYYAYYIEK